MAARSQRRRPARPRAKTGTTRIEREQIRPVARNRRARHEYDILDTFEAGLELKGAEVKSVRAGQVSLQDAYARVEDGEAWLLGARIAPYEYSSGFGAVEADRPRKLLLHDEHPLGLVRCRMSNLARRTGHRIGIQVQRPGDRLNGADD